MEKEESKSLTQGGESEKDLGAFTLFCKAATIRPRTILNKQRLDTGSDHVIMISKSKKNAQLFILTFH